MVTQTRPSASPRRTVGLPKSYGERRLVDKVEATLPRLDSDLVTPPAFSCCSPSDFLTPFTNSPQRQTMVAETTLTWSSNSSTPTGAAQSVSMTSTSWKTPFGNSTTQSINNKDRGQNLVNYRQKSETLFRRI